MNNNQSLDPEPITPLYTKRNGHKGLKVSLIVLLSLVTLGSIGYSVYAFMQNKTQESSISSKDQQIKTLNSQIVSLKPTITSTDTTTNTTSKGNVIPIRELGVSITVPDSIKDLTYSYKSFPDGTKVVGLSTQAITYTYNKTNECTSYNTTSGSPALGFLEKVSGKYTDTVRMDSQLVRQFSGYFIDFAGPQAACADNQGPDVLNALKELKDAFSTIKEL